MTSLKETAATLAYRLAMGEGVTYGTLRMHARSSGHGVEELAGEILRLCDAHGIDATPLASSVPQSSRKKLGLEKPAGREPAGRWKKPEKERFTYRGAPKQQRGGRHSRERSVLSRKEARDRWAQEHGYKSWTDYALMQHARQLGFKDRSEYDRAVRGMHGERYVALLSNMYRAGLQRGSADRLADLIVTKKNLPRAKLRKRAWELSKLPMLYPGKKRRLLDASLPKYRKLFGRGK